MRFKVKNSLFISAFVAGISMGVHATTKPNLIVILSDNQDRTETSVQMHPDLPNSKSRFIGKPNREKMAAQGITFSTVYAP